MKNVNEHINDIILDDKNGTYDAVNPSRFETAAFQKI